MPSGLILLDKAAGCSSAQAVAGVKRRLGLSKIGHAGTLDPMASGLLVCLCGAATRFADYAQRGAKTYSGEILLGLSTDSDDITGRELSRCEAVPVWERVEKACRAFIGRFEQIPPSISAIKVGGQRAYRMARAGQEPALKGRMVEVFSLDVQAVDERRLRFRLNCSKGFYVRALARDLGQRLGCGAVLSVLRREVSEPFSVQEAVMLENLEPAVIRPIERLFPGAIRLEVEHEKACLLLRGDSKMLYCLSPELDRLGDAQEALYIDRRDGRACGLLLKEAGRWRFGVNIPDGE